MADHQTALAKQMRNFVSNRVEERNQKYQKVFNVPPTDLSVCLLLDGAYKKKRYSSAFSLLMSFPSYFFSLFPLICWSISSYLFIFLLTFFFIFVCNTPFFSFLFSPFYFLLNAFYLSVCVCVDSIRHTVPFRSVCGAERRGNRAAAHSH